MWTVRRAAGTRTFTDLLRHPGDLLRRLRRRPFGDPAQDVAAFRQGQPVAVSGFRLDSGKVRHGLLVVQARDGVPRIDWRPYAPLRGYREAEAPAQPARWPADPAPVRWKRLSPAFTPANLAVGDTEWLLAVPRHDLPFLREVVPAAEQHGP